jgi:hypothetical protein
MLLPRTTVLVCDLIREYIRKYRTIFEPERGTFTEVQFEDSQNDVLHILRPLEKLIYFGREDSAWGEADKLALVDMALETEFCQMRYFQDNFLPGMMGTQFSLYRQSQWEFVFFLATRMDCVLQICARYIRISVRLWRRNWSGILG